MTRFAVGVLGARRNSFLGRWIGAQGDRERADNLLDRQSPMPPRLLWILC